MGRGKIEIKKIENASSRQVTFSKRRSGLFKKAHELAVLCEADVAVIIFSNTGRLFDFSSSSMRNILARYKKGLEASKVPALEYRPEKQEQMEPRELHEADFLRAEIEKLRLKQLQLLGKHLDGMGLPELNALEQQLSEGLICVKERKEQVLLEQLEQYKVQEKRAELENENLRRQVEELRAYLPSSSSQNMLCIEYNSTPKETMPTAVMEGSRSPEKVLEDAGDSDTILQLGPPSMICRKRKTPDNETDHSNSTSETRIRLE